eukprot:s831_g9.t1
MLRSFHIFSQFAFSFPKVFELPWCLWGNRQDHIASCSPKTSEHFFATQQGLQMCAHSASDKGVTLSWDLSRAIHRGPHGLLREQAFELPLFLFASLSQILLGASESCQDYIDWVFRVLLRHQTTFLCHQQCAAKGGCPQSDSIFMVIIGNEDSVALNHL